MVATVIWQWVSNWCKIPNIFGFSVRDLLVFHNYIGPGELRKKVVHGIIILACWCIWNSRNEKIFSNKDRRIEDITSRIKSYDFLRFKNRSKYRSIS
ncbi:hypothetical protein Hanom_Chr02g00113661 [Helianthus anomalus]